MPDQPFALYSKQYLENLVKHKTVLLKHYGMDPYNRLISEVFIDGINVNLNMVRVGLVEVYTEKSSKQLNINQYIKAEQKAHINERGIWADPYRVTPQQWRATH